MARVSTSVVIILRTFGRLIAEYLSSRFCFIDDGGEPVFASTSGCAGRFEKLIVKGVNSAAPNQKIDIDHYWYDPDQRVQYVFDAKYYAQVLS